MNLRRAVAALIPVALALACAKRDRSEAFKPLAIGEAVPLYSVIALSGDTIRLGGAQPLTVLNVWATWCSSCREEMEDLKLLSREFASAGVRVVGVSVDEGDGTRVRRFAEAEKLTFAVGHDPQQRVQRLYQVVGVPETFVLSADGRLLWRYVGNVRPVLDSLRSVIATAASS